MIHFPNFRFVLPWIVAGAAACTLQAQDGALDSTYNPLLDNTLQTITVQPDGKALVSGTFRSAGGQPHAGVVRFNVDGTLDGTFNNSSNLGLGRGPITVQPDGKIVTVVSGDNVVRLNADGSGDAAFNANSIRTGGVGSSVFTLVVQPDGKILVGADTQGFQGLTSDGVVRLNADGTIDTSFVSQAGFFSVKAIVLLADGTLYVAGGSGGGSATHPIEMARLSASGALLATVDATPSTAHPNVAAQISQLQLQPDGKVLLSGDFGTIQGVARPTVARLNADGTVDPSFDPGTGPANFSSVEALLLQTDGKVVVGGGFTSFNGTTRNRVARLNTDGSVDPSFDPGAGAGSATGEFNGVEALAFQPDGKLLVGGDFTLFGGATHQALARLNNGGGGTAPPPPVKQANLHVRVTINDVKINTKGKTILKAILAIANHGRKNAKNVEIAAYVSDDGVLDAGDVSLGSIFLADYGFPVVPKNGPTTRFAVRFAGGAGQLTALTGKYLVIVVDPEGLIPDSDRADNQIVVGPLP